MRRKLMLFIMAATSATAYAGNMTNSITGLYNTSYVKTAVNPVLCIKEENNNFVKWDYGQTLDPYKYSGNPNYFGVAIRNGGCSTADIYFGWMGVSGNKITYQPSKGSHIQLLNYKINNDTVEGNLGFTELGPTDNSIFPTNLDTTKPDNMTWFAGINLSGLEFSTMPNDSVIPNLSQADENTLDSDLSDTATFLKQGANIIRLPIRWAYLKPDGPNSNYFDNSYLQALVLPTLETITSHKYYVILDLHSYMHYATVGNQVAGCGGPDGQCPDGTLVKEAAPYVAVWSNIWSAIKKDPKIKTDHLLFDIVNEPTADGKLTAQDVFNMEVAVIKQLQSMGFDGYYLVEGVHWSGLHSWEQTGNAAVFTRQNFLKAGITKDALNKIIINVHQYLDSNFSGTQNQCLQNIYTTGTNGFNLQSFVNYLQHNSFKAMVTEFGVGSDQQSCAKPLNDFLTFLKNNAYTPSTGYGFVGWTVWSTGHGWGNYNLRVKPNDWKDKILMNYFSMS